MKVHNNCFPSLSDKYLCGDLLGSQLSLGHKHSHLNQLQDRGLLPRNAPSPMLPCLCWMTFTTKAIFFPLIKLTKQVLQDVLISRSRCLPAPWHSRGSWVAAGLCSRCSGCSQRVWWLSCAGSGGTSDLGTPWSGISRLEVSWLSAARPGGLKVEKAGSGETPWQGPTVSWHSWHSVTHPGTAHRLKSMKLKNCSCLHSSLLVFKNVFIFRCIRLIKKKLI